MVERLSGWVQVWALAGPLKDIHRVVPKPLWRCLGCVLRVIFLSEVLNLLGCLALPLKKKPSQQDAVTTMLQCWDAIVQVMSGAWFPPDMMLRMEAIQFNCFIRPENLVSHSLSPLGAFLQTPSVVSYVFH